MYSSRTPLIVASVALRPSAALHSRMESPSVNIAALLSSFHNGASLAMLPTAHSPVSTESTLDGSPTRTMTTLRSSARPRVRYAMYRPSGDHETRALKGKANGTASASRTGGSRLTDESQRSEYLWYWAPSRRFMSER